VSRLSKVFAPNWEALNFTRSLAVLGVMVMPLIALTALGEEDYWLSASFGALFVGLSDLEGDYATRAQRMGVVAVIGALLTLLGFGIGTHGWGLVVLAAFVVTLVAGLALKFGVHRFVTAYLLNVWFIIALGLPATYALGGVKTHAGLQALAWIAGSALWVALLGVLWLARGRGSQPSPFPEIPGDTSPRELTRPVILFAVIRALALSAAVAIAFGLHLPNAYWMPIATLVAMKPNLEESAFVAEQRLAGAIVGAGVASLFLLTVDGKHALEAIIVLLAALGGALRTVNYALYTAAIAALVLIAANLPNPSNLSDEVDRVLYTFAGLAIGVAVMFLANLLAKRRAPAVAPAAT
jgi:Fusaric acid resistance protein-like